MKVYLPSGYVAAVALVPLHVFSPGGTQLEVQPYSGHATLLADKKEKMWVGP